MPELLLEVGMEELPAHSVRRAYIELGARICSLLTEAQALEPGAEPKTLGTPRRLIVSLPEVAERQRDAVKEQRGPGLKAAYDANGAPTQALLGFCRSQGVDAADLRNDGQYVWVTKAVPGRATSDLLTEILPKAITGLTFDKTMRWGHGRLRFARPIRWLLALFGGEVVQFSTEGVQSGNASYGHRFYARERFEASSFEELVNELRARHVEPDPEERRKAILEGARKVATGDPILADELVEENVFLTEWPAAICGSFHEEYLELPRTVLETAMAKHERMFPVLTSDGSIVNKFVFIRNSGEDDSVRAGCEWVLNARFNDAKFFFDEDKRSTFDEFLQRTAGILFMDRLGNVRQRTDRFAGLARIVGGVTGAGSQELEYLLSAAKYAKADLSTGLVGELASLQGVIGGIYANRAGLSDAACWAISTQYDLSKNLKPETEAARTAVRLVMIDQLDKLAGTLGIGLEPTGSSDPYGLRRAATLLIEAALSWPGPVPGYLGLFLLALQEYGEQGFEVDREGAVAALKFLFESRYEALMPEVRYDILQGALGGLSNEEILNPQRVRVGVQVLAALAEDIPFVQTATRPMNIVIAARKKGIEFGEADPLGRLEHSALESASGLELFEVLSAQEEDLFKAAKEQGEADVIRFIRNLQEPINRFFADTMVMADQPDVRYARLTLMHATSLQLLTAGDFSRIVVEG